MEGQAAGLEGGGVVDLKYRASLSPLVISEGTLHARIYDCMHNFVPKVKGYMI